MRGAPLFEARRLGRFVCLERLTCRSSDAVDGPAGNGSHGPRLCLLPSLR
jgi:hypothetical protein